MHALKLTHRTVPASDQALGAVIHGFAMAGDHEEAKAFFDSVAEGTFGVPAGPACYNGLVLSYVRRHDWEDAMETYSQMKETHVNPDPTTFHGLLIAAHRLGGNAQVIGLLEEIQSSDASISIEGFLYLFKLFFPELKGTYRSIEELRLALRALGDNYVEKKDDVIDLLRALRKVQAEDARETSEALPEKELKKRREKAWSELLNYVIFYAKQTTLG